MKKLNIMGKFLQIIALLLVTNIAFAQSLSGKTQWSSTVELSSRVSSSVVEILVHKGQSVKVGDDLIKMDKSLLLLDHQIAQAHLASLAPIKEMEEMDLNRALELYDRELLTDVDLKNAELKFAQIQAEFDAAQATLDKAELLLQLTSIKSPINGTVLSINKALGYYSDVTHAESLISLVTSQDMKAVAFLKVSQWDSSLVGKKVTVALKNKSYKGVIESLALMPVENDKGLSLYPIEVKFSPKVFLPAGMPLTIEIQ